MRSLSFAFFAVLSATSVSCGLLPGSGDAPSLFGPDSAGTQTFQLHQNIVGRGFMDAFRWETFNDPTHGRACLLMAVSGNKFIMRPDFHDIVPSKARGRDSNRISSYNTYTDSVVILDVQHVPDSICSVWPAFWTVTASNNWPHGGEIDIYEGINKDEANLGSLHTTPGCTMSPTRKQTGITVSTNCDAYENNNQGCGTRFTRPASFGSSLNSIGGGWFVMKRTNDGVYLWFWGRRDPSVPRAVAQGGKDVAPDASWGTPAASFPSSGTCNLRDHLDAHRIVFDTTFCGDYAGSHYASSGCPGSCEDFVNNNPSAFSGAYWEINALRIYTMTAKKSSIL